MKRRNPEVPTPVIVLASLAAGGALAWWWMTRSPAPGAVSQAYVGPFAAEQQAIQLAQQARLAQLNGTTGPIYGGIPSLPPNMTGLAEWSRAPAPNTSSLPPDFTGFH